MQLTARLLQLLPLQTGQGKNGPWKKQDIIVETIGSQYPKKVCISIWGDKVDASLLREGATLTISFDVESREYNGRWYTDVKAWKVEAGSGSSSSGSSGPMAEPPVYNDIPQGGDKGSDDLPF